MKHSPWLILGILSLTQSGVSLAETPIDTLILSQNDEEDRSLVAQDSLSVEALSPDDQNTEDLESQKLPARKSRRISREREAEGTRAPNRFDNEILIKSRYELNGQPLEVDTD